MSYPYYINPSTQQHPIRPSLLRHIRKLDTSRMLLPRRQNPPDIQVPDVDLLILLSIPTTLQHLQLRIRIRRQEERQRVSLLPRLVPHAMHSRRKFSIRLLLEVLAHVADKGVWLGRRIDPDSVLVEDFEGGDGVLENEGYP